MSQEGLLTLISLVLLAGITGALSFLYFKKKKKVIGIILAILCFCPLALAVALCIMFQRTQHPLRYEESIVAPDGKYVFALYRDDRIGVDTSWHVFKLSQKIVAEKYRIPANYMNLTGEQSKKLRNKRALYISAKGEEYVGIAYLYIVHGKYLVLVRNGMFQGLYDIESDMTIIDDQSRIFAADIIDSNEAKVFINDLFEILKYPEPDKDEMEDLVAGIQRSHVNETILEIIDIEKHDPNS